MTPSRSHANAAPAASGCRGADDAREDRLEQRRPPDLARRRPDRAQKAERAPPLDGRGDERIRDAEDRDPDAIASSARVTAKVRSKIRSASRRSSRLVETESAKRSCAAARIRRRSADGSMPGAASTATLVTRSSRKSER